MIQKMDLDRNILIHCRGTRLYSCKKINIFILFSNSFSVSDIFWEDVIQFFGISRAGRELPTKHNNKTQQLKNNNNKKKKNPKHPKKINQPNKNNNKTTNKRTCFFKRKRSLLQFPKWTPRYYVCGQMLHSAHHK